MNGLKILVGHKNCCDKDIKRELTRKRIGISQKRDIQTDFVGSTVDGGNEKV